MNITSLAFDFKEVDPGSVDLGVFAVDLSRILARLTNEVADLNSEIAELAVGPIENATNSYLTAQHCFPL